MFCLEKWTKKDNNELFCQKCFFLFFMKYTSSEKQR